MVKITPVGASSKINMLLHSDTGVGKTTWIGTGGKKYKILIMRPPIDHTDPIVGSGVSEAVVYNWEDVFEVLDMMRHEGHKWDWFCIDSISLLQDIGLDDVYYAMLDTKGQPGSVARKAREMFGPDRGEYRTNMWRLEQFVRHAVGAAQFNLCITAHSFWYEPEDESAYLMPWIQGKAMPSKICGMMNIIGYMSVKEREVRGQKRQVRVIEWNKTERFYAKNQFKMPDGTSVFPEGHSINSTMPDVVETINKGRPQSKQCRPVGRQRPAATPVVRRRTRRK